MFVASRWVIQGAIRVKVHRIGVHMQRPVFFFPLQQSRAHGRTNALMQRLRGKKTEEIRDSERGEEAEGRRGRGKVRCRGGTKRRRSMLCRYIPTLVRTRVQSLRYFSYCCAQTVISFCHFFFHETQIQLIISCFFLSSTFHLIFETESRIENLWQLQRFSKVFISFRLRKLSFSLCKGK